MEYEFDRYIDGRLMAEGVAVEKAKTLADAALKASKIARRGQNGQSPVLVLANGKDRIEALELELGRLLMNASLDARLLADYHKWCEMNGCAPASSDLIAARAALEGKG